MMTGEFYRRILGRILAWYIRSREAQKRLKEMHNKTCGFCRDINLYHRLQRSSFYWLEMCKEAAQIQSQYASCQLAMDREESYDIFTNEDWRNPFIKYLTNGNLYEGRHRLKTLATRYFSYKDVLFKKGYDEDPLRCFGSKESKEILKKLHSGECGEH